MSRPAVLLACLVALLLLDGCAVVAVHAGRSERAGEGGAVPRRDEVPERFTIVPDDYHVPYAGTAEDGRRFFLSDELFTYGSDTDDGTAYVGLFLWHADGTFSDLRVTEVPRAGGLPPGQAGSAGADELVEQRLAELGDYRLEPIRVEPFTRTLDGVVFGWRVSEFEGSVSINIEPGDFIAYNPPWDGLEYDT